MFKLVLDNVRPLPLIFILLATNLDIWLCHFVIGSWGDASLMKSGCREVLEVVKFTSGTVG